VGVFAGVTGITEQGDVSRQGHWHHMRGFAMKLMLPLMMTAPTLIQGGLAMRARRAPDDVRTRQLWAGIVFNVCWLVAVGVVSLMLALD
jgi:hypothetical protein